MTIDKKMLSVIGIAIISFFSTLWVRPADLMESRNFISAREIIANNEWLVTTLNGAYRFEKPPLPTWLTAFTMQITNNFSGEWVLRLPVAFITVLLALYMYKFVDECTQNKNLAFLSSFVLSTTLMIIKVGGTNSWDAYPYIFMFISLYYCLKLFNSNKIVYSIPAAFFLACSILSKGPVALYGMLLPFFIAYAIVYKIDNITRNKKAILIYFGFGLALASFWPIAMMIENADVFISVLIKEKNTWSHNHIRPWYFYFDFFAFMGIWAVFSITTLVKKLQITEKENKLFLFGKLWSVLTFVFLSIISMKKERYGFPMYIEFAIPLSILLHHYLSIAWSSLKSIEQKCIILQYVIVMMACIISIGLILWKANTMDEKILLSLPFFVLLTYMTWAFIKRKSIVVRNAIYCSGVLMLLVNINVTWIIEHTFRGAKHIEMPALEELQKMQLDKPIYAHDFSVKEVWNVGQCIQVLGENTLLPSEFYILGDISNLPNNYEIVSQKTYRIEQNKDKIILFTTVKQNSIASSFSKHCTSKG